MEAREEPEVQGDWGRGRWARRRRQEANRMKKAAMEIKDEPLHHVEEVQAVHAQDRPDPVNGRRRSHRNRRRKGKADGAEDSSGARRPPGPGPARPAPGRVKQLVEELELDKCDFLEQPGRREQVEQLLGEFHDIFTTETKKVGMVPDRYRTTIKLKPGTVPIKQKLRPMHPQQQADLKIQLDEWLKEGVIRPSKSPWASPLVPVKKKDGRTRWCVDYRQVNARTVGDSFPSPTVEEILAGVGGGARNVAP
mgnify:CR=1 FL=1